ncbi:MAG: FtsH protease activity modulator HflK [Gammaproteobacteria bacterium]
MSWNEPNDNNRDPWGGQKPKQSPPDLDKMIQNLVKKFRQAFKSRSSGFQSNGSGQGQSGDDLPPSSIVMAAISFFAIIILVLWAAVGIFIVAPADQAVVLRFGKYVETVGPGPHWIPPLIDTYYKVNVQRVSSFQFKADILTKSSGESDKPEQVIKVSEVTGTESVTKVADDTDKNVVYIELSVQYRIADPKLYLFNIVNANTTLEDVSKSVLSQVVGTMKLSDVLTTGRDELAMDVSKMTQALMDQYGAGIEIVAANVRKAQAPEEVADAFLDVVQAGQDEQRYIQQAQAYASKVVPIAEGAAKRILADAEGYRQRVILTAQGDIASYNALLSVYKSAPSVTKERLYLDTMQTILEHTSKLLVDVNNSNNLLYLPIDKIMKPMRSSGASEKTDQAPGEQVASADEAAQTSSSSQDLYQSMYRGDSYEGRP